jgi:hypothetical protein
MVQRRTNNGQIIDLDQLFAQQGDRPAVGNMRTDAQGNVLDEYGNIVTPKEERVRAYYKDNPKSSTAQQSIKGQESQQPLDSSTADVKTAKTQKENIRTTKIKPDTQKQPEPEAPQGESFDNQEPLGFKEVELSNGDIDMVPYYTQEDAPDGEDKAT